MRRKIAAALAITFGASVIAPTAASAHHRGHDRPGPDRTIADVLLADSDRDDENGFDRRWYDYDIVTQAVLLFPDLVEAASDADAELTVFLPNDRAFRKLVKDITGERLHSEADVFAAVADLGTDTVKNVLTYHIVPASISYRDALKSDGAVLDTLLPDSTIEVDVRGKRWWSQVRLVDADTDDRDPKVRRPNIGGELENGYAHGIDRVLRPIDLP